MHLTSNSSLMSKDRSSVTKLFALGLVVACPLMLVGMNQAFAIVALPQLNLNVNDESWFASISAFSAPLGSIFIGFIIDKFGRRIALLCGVLPSCFGWCAIYFSNDTTVWLFVGRTLNGLCLGALMYPPQVYASECLLVNHQRLRDSFKIWTGVAGSIGLLSTFFISLYLDYRQLSAFMILVSLVEFVLIYIFIPESPSWLQYQGRHGDAEWSQKKLGIYPPILQNEDIVKVIRELNSANKFQWSEFVTDLGKIKRQDVYKPLIRTMLLFSLLMGTGGMPILMYMIEIIGDNPSDLQSWAIHSGEYVTKKVQNSESLKYSIISGVFALIANVMLCFTLPYLGIRKIAITCLIGMAGSLSVLAFTVIQNSPQLYIMHVASVWITIFMFDMGVFNIPSALLGHVFPIDAKGFASISAITFCLLGGIAIKLHPYLVLAFGGYLYYGYAMMALGSALYAFYFMPETVGRSLRQISSEFTNENGGIAIATNENRKV